MDQYEVIASALNLRNTAGTQGAIVAQLPRGTLVNLVDENQDGSWSQVTTTLDDKALQGWVSSVYLQAVEPEEVISNVVIDLSHHNQLSDVAALKADGVLGVIHKATQGSGFVDDEYAARRKLVTDAGLLWGAYHFGTDGDGITQAQHFLTTAQPDEQTLLVLDFEEDTTSSQSMSLTQARDFVGYIQEQTGRWSGIYGGHYLKEQLADSDDAILSNCWLWISQYGSKAVIPPCWSKWSLWQYTDGSVGPEPHTVNGVGACDRDKFNGDIDSLHHFWGSTTT